MKVVQIVKKLNNTELGKAGTHDAYVLVPRDLDVSCIFDKENTPTEFIDKETKEKVTVRNTVDREKRIVGLGQYYKNKELYAGDEIVFEKQVRADKAEYYIHAHKKSGNLVVQKSRYGFEILTPERLALFRDNLALIEEDVQIEYVRSMKKRNDSPEKTDYYDIQIAGRSILDSCSGKAVELEIRDNRVWADGFYGWKKFEYEMED